VCVLQLFRLLWPEDVAASAAVCQRSQTTGELLVTVPAAVQRAGIGGSRRAGGLTAIGAGQPPQPHGQQRPPVSAADRRAAPTSGAAASPATAAGTTTARKAPRKLADEVSRNVADTQ
jgi:hypothetical protein